jgi:Stress responsive A/B Barrel Domain
MLKNSISKGLFLLLLAVMMLHSNASKAQSKELRHVVIFKFKDSSSAEDIKQVETAFKALPEKIKEVKGYEWGINNSPEGLAQGFTHCFFLTFGSEEDRATYLPHPAHQAFVKILSPHLDKVMVLDYWAQK